MRRTPSQSIDNIVQLEMEKTEMEEHGQKKDNKSNSKAVN